MPNQIKNIILERSLHRINAKLSSFKKVTKTTAIRVTRRIKYDLLNPDYTKKEVDKNIVDLISYIHSSEDIDPDKAIMGIFGRKLYSEISFLNDPQNDGKNKLIEDVQNMKLDTNADLISGIRRAYVKDLMDKMDKASYRLQEVVADPAYRSFRMLGIDPLDKETNKKDLKEIVTNIIQSSANQKSSSKEDMDKKDALFESLFGNKDGIVIRKAIEEDADSLLKQVEKTADSVEQGKISDEAAESLSNDNLIEATSTAKVPEMQELKKMKIKKFNDNKQKKIKKPKDEEEKKNKKLIFLILLLLLFLIGGILFFLLRDKEVEITSYDNLNHAEITLTGEFDSVDLNMKGIEYSEDSLKSLSTKDLRQGIIKLGETTSFDESSPIVYISYDEVDGEHTGITEGIDLEEFIEDNVLDYEITGLNSATEYDFNLVINRYLDSSHNGLTEQIIELGRETTFNVKLNIEEGGIKTTATGSTFGVIVSKDVYEKLIKGTLQLVEINEDGSFGDSVEKLFTKVDLNEYDREIEDTDKEYSVLINMEGLKSNTNYKVTITNVSLDDGVTFNEEDFKYQNNNEILTRRLKPVIQDVFFEGDGVAINVLDASHGYRVGSNVKVNLILAQSDLKDTESNNDLITEVRYKLDNVASNWVKLEELDSIFVGEEVKKVGFDFEIIDFKYNDNYEQNIEVELGALDEQSVVSKKLYVVHNVPDLESFEYYLNDEIKAEQNSNALEIVDFMVKFNETNKAAIRKLIINNEEYIMDPFDFINGRDVFETNDIIIKNYRLPSELGYHDLVINEICFENGVGNDFECFDQYDMSDKVKVSGEIPSVEVLVLKHIKPIAEGDNSKLEFEFNYEDPSGVLKYYIENGGVVNAKLFENQVERTYNNKLQDIEYVNQKFRFILEIDSLSQEDLESLYKLELYIDLDLYNGEIPEDVVNQYLFAETKEIGFGILASLGNIDEDAHSINVEIIKIENLIKETIEQYSIRYYKLGEDPSTASSILLDELSLEDGHNWDLNNEVGTILIKNLDSDTEYVIELGVKTSKTTEILYEKIIYNNQIVLKTRKEDPSLTSIDVTNKNYFPNDQVKYNLVNSNSSLNIGTITKLDTNLGELEVMNNEILYKLPNSVGEYELIINGYFYLDGEMEIYVDLISAPILKNVIISKPVPVIESIKLLDEQFDNYNNKYITRQVSQTIQLTFADLFPITEMRELVLNVNGNLETYDTSMLDLKSINGKIVVEFEYIFTDSPSLVNVSIDSYKYLSSNVNSVEEEIEVLQSEMNSNSATNILVKGANPMFTMDSMNVVEVEKPYIEVIANIKDEFDIINYDKLIYKIYEDKGENGYEELVGSKVLEITSIENNKITFKVFYEQISTYKLEIYGIIYPYGQANIIESESMLFGTINNISNKEIIFELNPAYINAINNVINIEKSDTLFEDRQGYGVSEDSIQLRLKVLGKFDKLADSIILNICKTDDADPETCLNGIFTDSITLTQDQIDKATDINNPEGFIYEFTNLESNTNYNVVITSSSAFNIVDNSLGSLFTSIKTRLSEHNILVGKEIEIQEEVNDDTYGIKQGESREVTFKLDNDYNLSGVYVNYQTDAIDVVKTNDGTKNVYTFTYTSLNIAGMQEIYITGLIIDEYNNQRDVKVSDIIKQSDSGSDLINIDGTIPDENALINGENAFNVVAGETTLPIIDVNGNRVYDRSLGLVVYVAVNEAVVDNVVAIDETLINGDITVELEMSGHKDYTLEEVTILVNNQEIKITKAEIFKINDNNAFTIKSLTRVMDLNIEITNVKYERLYKDSSVVIDETIVSGVEKTIKITVDKDPKFDNLNILFKEGAVQDSADFEIQFRNVDEGGVFVDNSIKYVLKKDDGSIAKQGDISYIYDDNKDKIANNENIVLNFTIDGLEPKINYSLELLADLDYFGNQENISTDNVILVENNIIFGITIDISSFATNMTSNVIGESTMILNIHAEEAGLLDVINTKIGSAELVYYELGTTNELSISLNVNELLDSRNVGQEVTIPNLDSNKEYVFIVKMKDKSNNDLFDLLNETKTVITKKAQIELISVNPKETGYDKSEMMTFEILTTNKDNAIIKSVKFELDGIEYTKDVLNNEFELEAPIIYGVKNLEILELAFENNYDDEIIPVTTNNTTTVFVKKEDITIGNISINEGVDIDNQTRPTLNIEIKNKDLAILNEVTLEVTLQNGNIETRVYASDKLINIAGNMLEWEIELENVLYEAGLINYKLTSIKIEKGDILDTPAGLFTKIKEIDYTNEDINVDLLVIGEMPTIEDRADIEADYSQDLSEATITIDVLDNSLTITDDIKLVLKKQSDLTVVDTVNVPLTSGQIIYKFTNLEVGVIYQLDIEYIWHEYGKDGGDTIVLNETFNDIISGILLDVEESKIVANRNTIDFTMQILDYSEAVEGAIVKMVSVSDPTHTEEITLTPLQLDNFKLGREVIKFGEVDSYTDPLNPVGKELEKASEYKFTIELYYDDAHTNKIDDVDIFSNLEYLIKTTYTPLTIVDYQDPSKYNQKDSDVEFVLEFSNSDQLDLKSFEINIDGVDYSLTNFDGTNDNQGQGYIEIERIKEDDGLGNLIDTDRYNLIYKFKSKVNAREIKEFIVKGILWNDNYDDVLADFENITSSGSITHEHKFEVYSLGEELEAKIEIENYEDDSFEIVFNMIKDEDLIVEDIYYSVTSGVTGSSLCDVTSVTKGTNGSFECRIVVDNLSHLYNKDLAVNIVINYDRGNGLGYDNLNASVTVGKTVRAHVELDNDDIRANYAELKISDFENPRDDLKYLIVKDENGNQISSKIEFVKANVVDGYEITVTIDGLDSDTLYNNVELIFLDELDNELDNISDKISFTTRKAKPEFVSISFESRENGNNIEQGDTVEITFIFENIDDADIEGIEINGSMLTTKNDDSGFYINKSGNQVAGTVEVTIVDIAPSSAGNREINYGGIIYKDHSDVTIGLDKKVSHTIDVSESMYRVLGEYAIGIIDNIKETIESTYTDLEFTVDVVDADSVVKSISVYVFKGHYSPMDKDGNTCVIGDPDEALNCVKWVDLDTIDVKDSIITPYVLANEALASGRRNTIKMKLDGILVKDTYSIIVIANQDR